MLAKTFTTTALLLGALASAADPTPAQSAGDFAPTKMTWGPDPAHVVDKRQGGGYRCPSGKWCGTGRCLSKTATCCGAGGGWGESLGVGMSAWV